jgi:hypothetical protein
MECPICLELFDSTNFAPKILIQCGHSFCKICLDRLSYKVPAVVCPVCREKTKMTKKEQIPTNYSLIELIEKNKDDTTKNLLEKYKYYDDKDYKHINQLITRNSEPKKLILKKIKNDDFIYVEEIENSKNYSIFSTFSKRSKRYNFNKSSMFRFMFNEYSYSLFVYRKSSHCKHQYSCLERVIRKLLIFGSITVLLKYPLNYILSYFVKNEESVRNYSLCSRIVFFASCGLFNISRCLVSFYMDDLIKMKYIKH